MYIHLDEKSQDHTSYKTQNLLIENPVRNCNTYDDIDSYIISNTLKASVCGHDVDLTLDK